MNWRKWIRPGLVVTVVVTLFAFAVQRGAMERDLSARVAAALATGGQTWAVVSASAQDIIISGTAPAAEARQAAVRAAAAVTGVRAVSDAITLLPVASPFVWSARRAGRQVTLSGSVPSEGVRASVLAAARRALPQAEIADRMNLARGAPPTFASAINFALTRLIDLTDGLATLSDSTLSLSGTATDNAAYASFRDALAKDLPGAVDIGAIDLLPPRASRFVWSANLDSASVTLAGNVPSEVVRQTISTTIKAIVPGLPVVDGVTLASGDPPGFAEAATFAATTLQRLKRGGVTLDGLSLDIAGEAKSVDDYAALLDSLGNGLPDGVKVIATNIIPPLVAPYVWQGDVSDGKVTLSGYAPAPDRKAELAAASRTTLAGLAVDDRVRVARGEPRMDWVGAVKFAMGQLALLGRGTVVISDTGYSISGEARDAKAYATILDQNAHTLPSGLTMKAANVQPPRVTPYKFSVERRDGNIIVSGYVGRDEDRQTVVAVAQRVAGVGDVIDKLSFASGAPDGFVGAATATVRALSRLAGGHADVIDQSVNVTGTAYQEPAVADVADSLREALPAGFRLANASIVTMEPGQPLAAATCRDQLQSVLKTGRIEFDANNPIVTTESLGVLDRAAGVLLRCPDANIEIGVHSDNDGTPAAALRDRTQARADTLADFLADAGVRRERLTAVGYGATKPVGDNNTTAGRAANRRVEFSVAVPAGG